MENNTVNYVCGLCGRSWDMNHTCNTSQQVSGSWKTWVWNWREQYPYWWIASVGLAAMIGLILGTMNCGH